MNVGAAAIDVFDVADRVITHGPYAKLSQRDERALGAWIVDRFPAAGEAYRVTIVADPSAIPPDRLERARDAALFILDHGVAGVPAVLEDAIARVVDAAEAADLSKGPSQPINTMVETRRALFAAIDHLRTTFEREHRHGQD